MRSLLDTSLLVYADAADEPDRQQRALALIGSLRAAGKAVLSTQVLQEYAAVALRELRLPPALVRERLGFYARFDLVATTPELMAAALDLHVLYQLSFQDALLLQAAIAAGCRRVLSEDLPHGTAVGGVQVVNPFLAL